MKRLGLEDKFTLPSRSKNFEDVKRHVRAGKLKHAMLRLDTEGMSSLEKTENRKSDSLKGMVIKQYLDDEDESFNSGTDSFEV